MKQIKIFLLKTLIMCFNMYPSESSNIQQPGLQNQTALKISLYLKDDLDITKKHLCNEFIIKEPAVFWDQDHTKIYCMLSKDTVRYGNGEKDPFSLSLPFTTIKQFIPTTTHYVPLKNNKASFEKDNFIFECEKILIKAQVQKKAEIK